MASRLFCCFAILSLAIPAWAGGKKFCSATADDAFSACLASVRDDFEVAQGICLNISAADERSACNDDAKGTRSDDQQSCKDQLVSRRDICKALGEARYEPDFSPALFDADFHHLTHPNPYFPVTIGDRWEYRTGSESDVVEMLAATKDVEGVTCIVSHDV